MEKSVLIVDGDQGVRCILRDALTKKGFTCHDTENSLSALDLFRQHHPAMVLVAVVMTDMDSTELINRIKQAEPVTEVFLIAGREQYEMVVERLWFGAADFIPKPVNNVMRDIAIKRLSERVEARAKLQQCVRNQALRDVVVNELIQEDVLVIGADYRILDVNDHLLKRLGARREEVIGHFCYEITHHQQSPCTGDRHPCPLLQTLQSSEPSQTTHIHRDRSGREITYSISCYPMIENDRVAGAIEISRDITGEIKRQTTLIQQEKLASIGRLAAGVAHEINNPLTTILTTSMLLQEDLRAEDPIYQELETIASETLRCRKIVTALLDFARQSQPVKQEIRLQEIIAETALLTRKQAAFKDVAVTAYCPADLPPIEADKGQIHQALINLVVNAIAATDPGGKISINCNGPDERDTVTIMVSDTGVGIPAEELERVFEPFFTTRETGTGLGLSITNGIVAQHGGSMEVNSTVGQGTTFTIRLPRRQGNHNGQ